MRNEASWWPTLAQRSVRQPLLRFFLAASLVAAASPSQAQQRIPSFAELQASGARIGAIHVVTQNIFDLDDPSENNAIYRLVNRLHIRTRPEVIERLLLFETGDPVSVRVIEETERLLRSKHYLYDVAIRPVAYVDGVVDIEVQTRDTWSLDIGVSGSRAGGENTGRLAVREDNLLGTGILLGISYAADVDRRGTTFEIADTNLLGTRAGTRYSYAHYTDGNSQVFELQRPFYALDARWAAGLSAEQSNVLEPVYNAGNKITEYRHRRHAVEGFGGWSPGLVNGWTQRYSVGLLHRRDDYALEADEPPPPRLPSDLDLVGPFVRFELIEDAFRSDVNLNLIGRVEDFAMGLQARLQLGRAVARLGSTRDAWLYNFSVGNGFDITEHSFMLTNVTASGRRAEGGENEALGASARYYYRHGRHVVYYAAVSADAVDNPDIPGPLQIGGENGLRGYPLRYQSGERRALLTLEARGYTDWYPFRLFRVGGALFYDTGRAWKGENQNTINGGWLRDVGFGLRLLSARTSKGNVLHADFAFPLDPDPSIDKVQFVLKTRVAF